MRNVQDIYPLSPMQEVMLLHSASGRANDLLLNQVRFDIEGALDVSAFRAAWGQLTERHAALRTAFAWQGLRRPMHIVRRAVDVDLVERDVSSAVDPQREVEQVAREDAQSPFDLIRAPLNRFVLVRRAPDAHSLLWSSHHLIFDRWCLGTLFDEFARSYVAALGGRRAEFQAAPSFRDYIAWLQAQDRGAARAFWHAEMGGLRRPPRLTASADGARESPSEVWVELGPHELRRVRAAATQSGVTLGVLVQTAWALTINHLTGAQDVVFGATVSGRPADLAGVESMVGSFVNNLPVRFMLSRDAALGSALAGAQRAQHRRSRYDYLALPEVHELAGLAPDVPLFDSLLVWLSPSPSIEIAKLKFAGKASGLRTGFPLTLSIAEDRDRLRATLLLAPRHRSVAPLRAILDSFLERVVALSNAKVDTALDRIDGFRGQVTFADRAAGEAVRTPNFVRADADHGGGRERIALEYLEELLRGEMQAVLGLDRIERDDDFFSLGGDSLRAASLHSRIIAATRQSVPLLALFNEPTIRGMARALRDEPWPLEAGICLPVRAHGELPPLFCVASPEVSTLGYSMLARHVAPERPVYVLQAPPDSDAVRRLSPKELPEFARRYVEAMCEVAPRAPYLLFGMCTGAQLCIEMARHLEARGSPPEFLGVVNTWGYYTVSRLIHLHRVFNRLGWYRQRLREAFAPGVRQGLAEVRLVANRRLQTTAQAVMSGPDFGPSERTASADPAEPVPNEGETDEWLNEYGPASRQPFAPPIRAEVTVFRIRKQPFWRIRDRALGWGRQASAVRVVDLEGEDHLAILREPSVAAVARHLEGLLGRARGSEAPR